MATERFICDLVTGSTVQGGIFVRDDIVPAKGTLIIDRDTSTGALTIKLADGVTQVGSLASVSGSGSSGGRVWSLLF